MRKPATAVETAISACVAYGSPGSSPTQNLVSLEVVVTESPAELRKVLRPELGIALIDLDRSES